MRRRPVLVVMARAPRAGAAKRRLSAEIGPAQALRFYRSNTAAALARLGRDPRWRCVLATTPGDFRPPAGWPRLPRFDQGRGDLGTRMMRALRRAGPGPALVVGSDIPGIGRQHIARAFRALAAAEVVLGPAEDGGFWLVGARGRGLPALRRAFDDIPWSSPHTLAATLARLEGRASVRLVDMLWDVDDRADYLRWRQRRRSFWANCSPSSGA